MVDTHKIGVRVERKFRRTKERDGEKFPRSYVLDGNRLPVCEADSRERKLGNEG